MTVLPRFEDFVLRLEKNARLKQARCGKLPSLGQQTTEITSPAFASLNAYLLQSCQCLVGTLRLCYFFFSFPPHYALLFFAQRWRWQSNSNLLYFGGSVQSCVNIVSYFLSLCFTSFVKTVLLFPVSLQLLLQPSIFHPFSLKTCFLLQIFLLDHDNIFLSRNLYFCIFYVDVIIKVPLRLPKYLLYTQLESHISTHKLSPTPCIRWLLVGKKVPYYVPATYPPLL